MTDTPADRQRLSLKFLLLLSCYFLLHILLRVLVSDSLDYDEAEQSLLGQWLFAGYTEQPPLYTWIQYSFFKLFGNNVFAVSLLKNCLLFLTYLFVFLSSRKILKDTRVAILATCSLLFIPQIAWESQRDMTHTTLVVCAATASLWQFLRLIKKQNLLNYALFGLLLAIGVLGKANFALFIATLLLTAVTFPEGRRVICIPQIGLTLLIVILVDGNYFLWMFNNQDIVFSVSYKFERAIGNYQLKGITSLFTNSFLFLTPMWLICLLIFPEGFGRKQNPETDLYHQFIKRYLLVLFLLLLTVVLVFKVTYVKDRWLQPLLFTAPIFFFSRLDPAQVSSKRFKLFLQVAALTAITIYLAFTVRVVGASYIHRFCRMNYPFTAMAEDLRQNGFSNGLIISDNRFLAGNMRLHFPGSIALIPDYGFESRIDTQGLKVAEVIWKADQTSAIPPELSLFLIKTFKIVPTEYPIKYFHHLYKYGRTETVTLAALQFPLPQK